MKSSVDDSRLLLTEAEAAERLSVSAWTLLKLRNVSSRRADSRRGPAFVRLGKSIRYRPVDLDAWIAENVVKPSLAAPTRRGGRPRKTEIAA